MKQFYSISIHGEFANILHIEKKDLFYNVIGEEIVEVADLPEYLKGKRSLYIVVTLDEVIDDIVTVPAVITSKELLKNYILKQFKESLPTKNILLNYHKISENEEESTVTYKVDAVNEDEYLQILSAIPDWKEIKSATINKFALLGMTKKCYDNHGKGGYFSVFTHGKTITVLAIDENNDLLFGRTTPNVLVNGNSAYLNVAEEVIQTVAYVKQKFRSINFDTLLISGTLSLDDSMAERLFLSTELKVAVIYPNTFISSLVHEEPQQFIITLGAFLVEKSDMFLPEKVYSLKQFDAATKILMFAAAITFVISSYFTLEAYERYEDSLERYDSIKNRLLRMVKMTHTYSLEELEKSYKHLEIAKKFLRNHPSDFLLKTKPLLELLPPLRYKYEDNDAKKAQFTLFFEKRFNRLSDLYEFQKKFVSKFQELNTDNSMQYREKTDYTQMKFKAEITNKTKTSPNRRARRRRR